MHVGEGWSSQAALLSAPATSVCPTEALGAGALCQAPAVLEHGEGAAVVLMVVTCPLQHSQPPRALPADNPGQGGCGRQWQLVPTEAKLCSSPGLTSS